MRKIAFSLILVCLLLGIVACRSRDKLGERVVTESELSVVKEVRFFSPSLGMLQRYLIILPKKNEREPLAVLYFLHGANSSPEEILRESPILSLAEQAPLAVVLPDAGYSYYTDAKYRVHSSWEQAILD